MEREIEKEHIPMYWTQSVSLLSQFMTGTVDLAQLRDPELSLKLCANLIHSMLSKYNTIMERLKGRDLSALLPGDKYEMFKTKTNEMDRLLFIYEKAIATASAGVKALSECQQELSDCQRDRDEHTRTALEFSKKVKELLMPKAIAEKQLAEMRAAKAVVDKQLADARAANQSLLLELEQTRPGGGGGKGKEKKAPTSTSTTSTSTSTSASIATMETRFAALEKELASQKAATSALEMELAAQQAATRTLETDTAGVRTKFERQSNKLHELNGALQSQKARLDKVEDENATLKITVADLEGLPGLVVDLMKKSDQQLKDLETLMVDRAVLRVGEMLHFYQRAVMAWVLDLPVPLTIEGMAANVMPRGVEYLSDLEKYVARPSTPPAVRARWQQVVHYLAINGITLDDLTLQFIDFGTYQRTPVSHPSIMGLLYDQTPDALHADVERVRTRMPSTNQRLLLSLVEDYVKAQLVSLIEARPSRTGQAVSGTRALAPPPLPLPVPGPAGGGGNPPPPAPPVPQTPNISGLVLDWSNFHADFARLCFGQV